MPAFPRRIWPLPFFTRVGGPFLGSEMMDSDVHALSGCLSVPNVAVHLLEGLF